MSSVDELMKKAVPVGKAFYGSSEEKANADSYEARRERFKKERKEKKDTLTQWYGMRRVKLTPEQEQDLELLRYRKFLDKSTAHQAASLSGPQQTEFVEFGYVAGTGRRKRKMYKTFADEWINESVELKDLVKRRMKVTMKRDSYDKKQREKASRKAKEELKKVKANGGVLPKRRRKEK